MSSQQILSWNSKHPRPQDVTLRVLPEQPADRSYSEQKGPDSTYTSLPPTRLTARPGAGSAPSEGLAPPPTHRYPRAELLVRGEAKGLRPGRGDAWAV